MTQHGRTEHERFLTEFSTKNLSLQDIISAFKEMGLFLEEEDITRPTCARITLLFECIIYLLTPWRAEIIEQKRITTNQSVELLVGSEPGMLPDVIIVFTYFQSLLLDINYTDFNMSDLTAPTTQRLLRILNVVVNYAKYSDLCWSEFEPFYSDLYQLIDEADGLESKVEGLEIAIIESKKKRKEEEPEVRRLQDMMSDIEHEIQEIRIQNESLTSELEILKTNRQDLKDNLQASQFTSLEDMEKSNHYQHFSEYDIEKYRKLSLEAKEQLKQVNSELEVCKQVHDSMSLEVAKVKMITRALHKFFESSTNLNTTMNTQARTIKTNKSVEKEYNDLSRKLDDLKLQNNYAERELAKIKRDKNLLEEQQEKKRESMEKFWEAAKEEDQKLELELEQLASDTQRYLKNAQEVDKEIESLKIEQMKRRQIILEHLKNKIKI